MDALPRTDSDALAERLTRWADGADEPLDASALLREAAGEIRRLLAVADFERGFRVATDLKLGEVLGRKA